MKRLLLLFILMGTSSQLFSQGITGKWIVWEGGDGADLIVSISADGTGTAELSLVRRSEAISHGEGSQFWGTFRTTGGYYFLVQGVMTEGISWTQSDLTLNIRGLGEPTISVSARLDEAYSMRELSDCGDYKEQVIAQWRMDFLTNEDVEKHKWIMENYFRDFYGDLFDNLLEGRHTIAEKSDSTMVLQNPSRGYSLSARRLKASSSYLVPGRP